MCDTLFFFTIEFIHLDLLPMFSLHHSTTHANSDTKAQETLHASVGMVRSIYTFYYLTKTSWSYKSVKTYGMVELLQNQTSCACTFNKYYHSRICNNYCATSNYFIALTNIYCICITNGRQDLVRRIEHVAIATVF